MNPNFFNFSKQNKHDLLTDLLLGVSTEGIVSKKELNALNKFIQGQYVKSVSGETDKLDLKRKKDSQSGKDPKKEK